MHLFSFVSLNNNNAADIIQLKIVIYESPFNVLKICNI